MKFLFFLFFISYSIACPVAVQLKPGADPDAIAREYGMINKGQIGLLENHYLFECVLKGTTVHEHEHVLWSEKQVKKERVPRYNDPLFDDQWYFGTNYISSVDIEKAWDRGFDGAGTQICIIDDGVNSDLEEFAGRFSLEGSYDFCSSPEQQSPTPSRQDTHGTQCATCAGAAVDNNICGAGYAPKANISGVRLISYGMVDDATEARAFNHRTDINHIYSLSYGPNDNGVTVDGPGPLTRAALRAASIYGRNGLGDIFVGASGNGRDRGDFCTYDGYMENEYILAIGAISYLGSVTSYSEGCWSLFGVMPSGSFGKSIVTCLITGDCSKVFSGTSATAPEYAGVVAIVMHIVNNYYAYDIKNILRLSMEPVDEQSLTWITNAVGERYSKDYGFGLINIEKMLDICTTYIPYGEHEIIIESDVQEFDLSFDSSGKTIQMTVHDQLTISRIALHMNIEHPSRGCVLIDIYSPSGTHVPIVDGRPGDTNSDLLDFHVNTPAFFGEEAIGTWNIVVMCSRNIGIFKNVQITLYGI